MEKNTRITLITCGSIVAVVIVSIIVAAIVSGSWLWGKIEQAAPSITITDRRNIGLLPTQLQDIRDIGQWEFLSVDDEELIDTIRPSILFDDHLACIYRGTLRLGIDMQELKEDKIKVNGDSVNLHLPQARLLDEFFIDDTRTEIFFEDGDWSSFARDELYRRAKEQMKRRALTNKNIALTQQLAEEQIRQLFHAMGFNYVAITFEDNFCY